MVDNSSISVDKLPLISARIIANPFLPKYFVSLTVFDYRYYLSSLDHLLLSIHYMPIIDLLERQALLAVSMKMDPSSI